jgi:subtilisin
MPLRAALAFLLVLAGPLAALAQDEIRVIVGFHGRADRATFARHGGAARFESGDFVAGEISARNLGRLRREAGVAYVEPDFIATADVQSIPWGVTRVKAASATTTGVGVRVAVLDTGVNGAHEDLVGQLAADSANFTTSPAADVDGHGTHVSGTIAAANNDLGVIGVAHGASIVPVKVLDDNGSGYYSWIASGILWAGDNGCKVINMSLGGSSGSSSLLNAVNSASGSSVICAAAGNNGNTRPNYPAYYSACVAVVAVDSADKRASFSTYGDWTDISAPGVGILSTTGAGYESWNGTSMATPHVSGGAALVWASAHGTSASNVRTRLLSTKGPNLAPPGKRYVPGILNCEAATK